MNLVLKSSGWLLLVVLMTTTPMSDAQAKGYSSSGGRSYSSGSHSSGGSSHSSGTHTSSSTHSSGSGSSGGRTSSGGSSKAFTSGSGRSYSSHSSQSGDPKGYSSGKSYSASNGSKYSPGRETKSAPASEKSTRTYSSSGGKDYSSGASPAASGSKRSDPAPNSFNFDTAAARAKSEEASKRDFNQYKEERQNANSRPVSPPVAANQRTYTGAPPPIQTTRTVNRTVYVPDAYVIRTRPARWGSVFSPYYYRPIVVYHDSYSSFFWWWLLDQSLDQRAYWAYHHRRDMDDARYQALLASDARLQTKVTELEAQQVAQDPSFTPSGLDRDLMYNDQYVSRAYSNRPTTGGKIAFWIFAVPTAFGASCFFIWIIWFKRWKTAA